MSRTGLLGNRVNRRLNPWLFRWISRRCVAECGRSESFQAAPRSHLSSPRKRGSSKRQPFDRPRVLGPRLRGDDNRVRPRRRDSSPIRMPNSHAGSSAAWVRPAEPFFRFVPRKARGDGAPSGATSRIRLGLSASAMRPLAKDAAPPGAPSRLSHSGAGPRFLMRTGSTGPQGQPAPGRGP